MNMLYSAMETVELVLNEGSDPEDFSDSGSEENIVCLLYTSPSPRDRHASRMPSSA